MTKKKRINRNQENSHQGTRAAHIRRKVISFIFFLITLGATLTTYYITFYPIISVAPNENTSTNNFSDTKFIITNESLLPIYNVQYYVKYWDGDVPRNLIFCFVCINILDKLSPHSGMSARVQPQPPIKNARTDNFIDQNNIKRPFYDFYVKFNFCFFNVKRGFRFWGYLGKDGKYIWSPYGDANDFKFTDMPKLNT